MEGIIATIAWIIFGFLFLRVLLSTYPGKDYNHVRFMTRVAIFGAIASILYIGEIFTIKVPFFPSFLSFHFDEIPAFICGFAYGPLAGVAVIGIKTILRLPFCTVDQLLGVAFDFVLSSIYVFIVTLVYKKKRNLKGVAIGFAIGTLFQVVVAMVANVYVMVPFYMSVYGLSSEALLGIMRVAMPAISDIQWSYAFIAVLPFNLIKDAIVILVTFLVYRSLHLQLRFAKNA